MGNLSRCFDVFDSKRLGRHKRPLTRIEDLCHRFSLGQLQKATNNFARSHKTGCGYRFYKGGINIGGTDHTVWIKRFSQERDHQIRQLSEFKNEIQLLCQLHHPNLVSLMGFCDEKSELIVVYEYMANGSLSDHVLYRDWTGIKPLSWKKRLEICIGAARGLHYLHTGAKHSIYHRDIRMESILLDEKWVPKVADFGISLKGPSFMSKPKSIQVDVVRGKVRSLPPEYSLDGTVTDKCDVYMFGMIMLEVVSGKKAIMVLMEMEDETKDHESKAEDKDKEGEDWKLSSSNIRDKLVRSYAEKANARKLIDLYIIGEVAPECWKIYMGIALSCILEEAAERPTMGEVQLELEHALEIQEAAEQANSHGVAAELNSVTHHVEIDTS